MISIGVESGDDYILQKIRKGETTEQIRAGCKMVKEAGLMLDASFMLGLPCETEESMNKTIRFAKELDPDFAHFAIAISYPGTEFYRIAQRENFPFIPDWSQFNFYTEAVYVPQELQALDIKKAYVKANREFYLRPQYIVKQLFKMRSFTNFKMVVKGGLSVLRRT